MNGENYSKSSFPQNNYPYQNYGNILQNKTTQATTGFPKEYLSFRQSNKQSTFNKTEVGVDFSLLPFKSKKEA